MAILPVGFAAEAGGYQIERSLRFNSADSAYLNRTPASAGSRTTMTFSAWLKLANLSSGTNQWIWGAVDDNYGLAQGTANDLRLYFSGTSYIITSAVFRDPSAWYHIVAAIDTTDATPSNRLKLYVNGIQQTIGSSSYPSSGSTGSLNNNVVHNIGRAANATRYWSGYLAEVHFIDGSALTPSSFGETDTDTGVWKPKAYSGSYGTNGFYLDFGDNSSTTALGYDAAGSNDWTPNNFSVTAGAGNDSLVDSPTRYGTDTGVGGEVRGNYATLNPLQKSTSYSMTLANGNLDISTSSTDWPSCFATIGVSSGKWYWEITCNTVSGSTNKAVLGIGKSNANINSFIGSDSSGWGYYNQNGDVFAGGSATSYGASYSSGDVIGVALDADNGTLVFYKNGTSQGTAATGLTSGPYFPVVSENVSSGTTSLTINFGQRPFAYTAPSGFKALCTTNLPEPTIAEGGEYMTAYIWTGDGSSTRSLTGMGFQPDWLWTKSRSAARTHIIYDVLRGVGQNKELSSASSAAEGSQGATGSNGYVNSLDSDGFSIAATASNPPYFNNTSETYVAWAWKANGSGVSNTAGTISSTVSANTTSGFSIIKYNGNSTVGATIGHGLGVAPSFFMIKRTSASGNDWHGYHKSLGNGYGLRLNTTDASFSTLAWNNTTPSSSVITLYNYQFQNETGSSYICYAFSEVAGYSAFGSYTGNGSTDGPFVFTGFRPRWIMFKKSSATDDWIIYDSVRDTYNVASKNLYANGSFAEDTNTTNRAADILSNGFKIRSSATYLNASGATFIYAAFAENPTKFALAR